MIKKKNNANVIFVSSVCAECSHCCVLVLRILMHVSLLCVIYAAHSVRAACIVRKLQLLRNKTFKSPVKTKVIVWQVIRLVLKEKVNRQLDGTHQCCMGWVEWYDLIDPWRMHSTLSVDGIRLPSPRRCIHTACHQPTATIFYKQMVLTKFVFL